MYAGPPTNLSQALIYDLPAIGFLGLEATFPFLCGQYKTPIPIFNGQEILNYFFNEKKKKKKKLNQNKNLMQFLINFFTY
jgi:hypothetical protein